MANFLFLAIKFLCENKSEVDVNKTRNLFPYKKCKKLCKKTSQRKLKVWKPEWFCYRNFLDFSEKGFRLHNGSGSMKNWACFRRMPQQPFIILCWVNCSSSDDPNSDKIYKYFSFQFTVRCWLKRLWFMLVSGLNRMLEI